MVGPTSDRSPLALSPSVTADSRISKETLIECKAQFFSLLTCLFLLSCCLVDKQSEVVSTSCLGALALYLVLLPPDHLRCTYTLPEQHLTTLIGYLITGYPHGGGRLFHLHVKVQKNIRHKSLQLIDGEETTRTVG